MPSLKSIRGRIRSVRNTQKITKAMKMVSAAKLRRAQEAIESSRAYVDALGGILQEIAARSDLSGHPMVGPREPARTVEVLVLGSDRGLCGAYNANVLKAAWALVQEQAASRAVRLTLVGKKPRDFFRRRGHPDAEAHIDLLSRPVPEKTRGLFEAAFRRFQAGEVDEVIAVYARFRSALVQTPTVERILPLPLEGMGPTVGERGREIRLVEPLYEPDRRSILEDLLPRYAAALLHRMALDAAASEHGSRMTAMDAASNNCRDLIQRLTLQMNRTRQAMITRELIEIISGAEAL